MVSDATRSSRLLAETRKTLTPTFSRRTRAKLAGARYVTLKLSVSASDASHNTARANRHLTLRR